MTTRSTLKPACADYADLEPLPDPPREPDMQQFEGVYAFASVMCVQARPSSDLYR